MSTVEERLTSVEARIDVMTDLKTAIAELRRELTAGRAEMLLGVGELRTDMSRQFEIVDARVDRHFVWLMGMLFTGFIAVIGALVGVVYR